MEFHQVHRSFGIPIANRKTVEKCYAVAAFPYPAFFLVLAFGSYFGLRAYVG
jgi:hypothetical protein